MCSSFFIFKYVCSINILFGLSHQAYITCRLHSPGEMCIWIRTPGPVLLEVLSSELLRWKAILFRSFERKPNTYSRPFFIGPGKRMVRCLIGCKQHPAPSRSKWLTTDLIMGHWSFDYFWHQKTFVTRSEPSKILCRKRQRRRVGGQFLRGCRFGGCWCFLFFCERSDHFDSLR